MRMLVAGVMISAGLALVACSGDHAPLTKDAATLLQAQVGNARTAASRGDVATATAQLDQARQSLDRLRRQGLVTRARADEITVAIAATQNALRASTSSSATSAPADATSDESTDTTSAPTSIESTEPSSSEPSTSTFPTDTSDQQGDHGNGRGRGNGD